MRSRRRPRKSSSECQPLSACFSRNRHPRQQTLDHVRPDRVIEHRRGADLRRAASEQEIVQRLRESAMPPMPEKLLSGNAVVICAILASDSGRIAGPPRPPYDTLPSTLTSNSSDSGSIGGSDVNVFDEEIASAPALNAASASLAMLVVVGVSLHPHRHLRHFLHDADDGVDELQFLPMFEPMSDAIHVRTRQVQLEGVDALLLTGDRRALPVIALAVVFRTRP